MSNEIRNIEFRLKAMELENVLLNLPQESCELVHNMVPGLYVRSCKVKAGTVITGAVFKRHHICISIGNQTIIDEDGPHHYEGVHVFNSRPGIKRVAHVHEDTVFITVHHTQERELVEIEREQVADTYLEYERGLE